jgi:hypothetical protein
LNFKTTTMNNTTTSVFEALKELDALTEKMEDTQWIVLDAPVRTALKTTRILKKGIMIRIVGCLPVNCTDDLGPTHVIIALRNNIHNTAFELDCEEIGEDEMITIKL